MYSYGWALFLPYVMENVESKLRQAHHSVVQNGVKYLSLLLQMCLLMYYFICRADDTLDYLLRVTVCSTFPFLSIMRSSSVFLPADTMEKPGSGLQNTVPSMGFTLRARDPEELVI